MSIPINQAPAAPQPNTVGHFAHHRWLEESVVKIAAEAQPAPSSVPEIDPSDDADAQIAAIVAVLVANGLATAKAITP